MQKELFGVLNGTEIYKYTISNGNLRASFLNYGATLQSFLVEQNGIVKDIVLGVPEFSP